jgi:UDP-N-acetylmuramoyl-L-alanyl-D-glutamate--2,6-diaminopimelate ligase
MKLFELTKHLVVSDIKGPQNVDITGIEMDSRKIKAGDLFVCTQGQTLDSHQFIDEAIKKGAAAIITEKPIANLKITYVMVPDARRALAVLADCFFEQPTKKFKLIGVTGTNGKTTTTNLIEKMLSEQGYKTGLIGTIHARIGNQILEESKNTTPDVLDLQRLFYKMACENVDYVIIEVSSHALSLGRTRGSRFQHAVFTNLTQDHLDYHQTMEHYKNAKGLLFSQLGNQFDRSQCAVLNADDPASKQYQEQTSTQVITYGIHNQADVMAKFIRITPKGTYFFADTFKGGLSIHLKLIGEFNIYNALAAIALGLAEGISLEKIVKSMEKIEGIRGRFEPIHDGQDFQVIIDYAHTPDGLKNVLETAKKITTGKLWCVFGCGGDRDRTKRPIMTEIATEIADNIILTSDNPRSEDPNRIIEEMLITTTKKEQCVIIVNREEAIEYAIRKATKGDCVVIAGKGHETYQIIQDQINHFDDREVAHSILSQKMKPL